jgi:deoxyribonuclease V
MIACLDVDYRDTPDGDTRAAVACVLLADWTDPAPARELTCAVENVAPYEPGAFYKRELPCLLAALAQVPEPLTTVVVDGYVWLGAGEDGTPKPGLGARLYDALGGRVPVVGVAKTAFRGAGAVTTPVVRGAEAKNPLHVTAVGMDPLEAARRVAAMHGPHRLPTALKRVDALCRAAPV